MALWVMSPTRLPLRHSAHELNFRPRVGFNRSHSKFDARSPLSQRGLRPPPHPPSPPSLQLGALVLLILLNERLATSHQPIVSLEPELPRRQVPGTAATMPVALAAHRPPRATNPTPPRPPTTADAADTAYRELSSCIHEGGTSTRTPGVEPGSQAWEACVMLLHYVRSCIKSERFVDLLTSQAAGFRTLAVCSERTQ